MAFYRNNAVFTRKMTMRTILIVYAITLCLLQKNSVVVLAGIQPRTFFQSAEIGQDGYVWYDVHRQGQDLPDILCPKTNYNCTTPHGLCRDNPDKYAIGNYRIEPYTDSGGHSWACAIRIRNVGISDVGEYMWCKLEPALLTEHGCLENNYIVSFSVWERDRYGRICQTSYDKTSQGIVNNCSEITTTLQTTKPTKEATTADEAITTKYEIPIIYPTGTASGNEAHSGINTSSAVGIPVTIVILIALLIIVVVYFYKRTNRGEHEHLPPGSPYANPTVAVILKDEAGITENTNEDTPLQENADT